MVRPDKHPHEVRDDQADPGDYAADSYAHCGYQGCADNNDATDAVRVHAEGLGLIVFEGKEVDAPS